MLNIHGELLDLMPSVISPDELVILMCIAKRINAKGQSYPGRVTLMRDTGYGKTKVSSITTSLEQKGLIKKEQRYKNGRLSSNLYTINTTGIGVYIPAFGITLESDESDNKEENDDEIAENTVTGIQDTEIQDTEKRSLSIVQSIEVLNRGEEESSSSELSTDTTFLSDNEIEFCSTLGLGGINYKTNHKYQKLFSWIKNRLQGEDISWYLTWLLQERANRHEWKYRGSTKYHGGWIRDFHAHKKENMNKTVASRKSHVFKPYWREYASRAEYEQAIEEARQNGQIVETDPLPKNAISFWGEKSPPEVQKLSEKLIYKEPEIDLAKRKKELLNQINSIQ